MFFSAALVALLPLLASAAPGIQRRATGVFIELERDQTQCLTVVQSQTGTFANGDAVTNRPCNGGRSGPQQWDISRGDGLIRVTGTNFCLDAGSNPSNNVPAKVGTLHSLLTLDLAMLPRSRQPAVVLHC
jgi:hypothetical protein